MALLLHLDSISTLSFHFPLFLISLGITALIPFSVTTFLKKNKKWVIIVAQKPKMSNHSGMTTSRSANIRYTFHNKYLIIRVTSTQRITHNSFINIAEDTSINNIWLRQKSQWCIYLFKAYYKVIKYRPKDWLINTSVTGDTSHEQRLPKRWTTHSPTITIVASGFSHNIPSTMLRRHPLDSLDLQSKHQSLYDCGVIHIRTGESMSSPPQ